MRRVLAALLIGTSAVLQCSIAPQVRGQDEANDAVRNEYVEKHIRPILVQRNQECHSEKSGDCEGGLVVDSRDALLKGGEQGPAIVPRDADHSSLIQAVRHTDPNLMMPPTGRLNDEHIAPLQACVQLRTPLPVRSTLIVPDHSDPEEGENLQPIQPLAIRIIPANPGVHPRDSSSVPADAGIQNARNAALDSRSVRG
jgi:hypothetical protein